MAGGGIGCIVNVRLTDAPAYHGRRGGIIITGIFYTHRI